MDADLAVAVRMIADQAGRERAARYEATRTRKAADRKTKKASRDAGLVARHTAKLGRKAA